MSTATASAFHDYFCPAVYTYSRQQAIDDGYLIDVTDSFKGLGFKVPIAITLAVWKDSVVWDYAEDSERQTLQTIDYRMNQLAWAARQCATHHYRDEMALFPLDRVPRDGVSTKPERVMLKIQIGPGDQGEPVVTIMLANES